MNPHITQIRQVLEEGRKFWGGQMLIDEERFYTATTKLRKSIPGLIQSLQKTDSIPRLVDTIENLVESGKARLFGKVLVRPSDFEPHLQALGAAIKALPPLQNQPPPSAESILENARLEAVRIIEEAHREADEIRRRAHQPRWSLGDDSQKPQ